MKEVKQMAKNFLLAKAAGWLFRSKAKQYLNDREKTGDLVNRAEKKALSNKITLANMWNKIRVLFQLIRAWAKGEYRTVPYRTILMIVIGLIYFVSPIDIIPDFLAGAGLVDDTAVLAFLLTQVTPDLEKFLQWKNKRDKS
ncbi:YkvA family protein [Heyndrickxia faecalis]|uniref:YkvA family protein n=2 Tax=Bacillaceae TaxID=186817 RepID=A0AAU7WEN9_9BACI